ncbi:MAG TPA: hypothetical protein DCF49_10385 [Lachnospiraceae bacterium]|nr:hypothetical protein [Lachnospiraceae bacterium]
MNQKTSAYERITELVSLLSDYDFEPTVRRISQKTECSLSQTREDLAQLHKLGISLYPADVAESLTGTESRYDDVILELDSDLPVRSSLLFLNPMERSLLTDNKKGRLLIKDASLPVSDSVRRHIGHIEEAIRQRCYIRFIYRSPVIGHNESIEIAPLRLFLNTTDGLYYCISINEEEKMLTYRLDRILFDVHIVKNAHYEDLHEKTLEKLDYVWGAAFENDSPPVHVRLEIHAGTPNILTKIRSETRSRRFASIRKEGDYYIYEDDVIGLPSFRSWVLSYGSSVKVLEPSSLAEQILISSRTRLLNYEDGNRFHDPAAL